MFNAGVQRGNGNTQLETAPSPSGCQSGRCQCATRNVKHMPIDTRRIPSKGSKNDTKRGCRKWWQAGVICELEQQFPRAVCSLCESLGSFQAGSKFNLFPDQTKTRFVLFPLADICTNRVTASLNCCHLNQNQARQESQTIKKKGHICQHSRPPGISKSSFLFCCFLLKEILDEAAHY